jgi:hypothetical protein
MEMQVKMLRRARRGASLGRVSTAEHDKTQHDKGKSPAPKELLPAGLIQPT